MDIRAFTCTYCTIEGLNCPDFLGFSALEADTSIAQKEPPEKIAKTRCKESESLPAKKRLKVLTRNK